MIELLQDSGLPDHVVAIRGSGRISRDDYETVFVPAVEKVLDEGKKVSVLIVFDADVDFSAGAVLEDTYFGTRHLFAWGRMAMVSDADFLHKATGLMFPLLPFKAKLFGSTELDAAKTWVAD